jgi:hypothetical protein
MIPMKGKMLLPIVLLCFITACDKDKFKTEPQVEINAISPSTVFSGDVISIEGKYWDDEGDLDSFYIVYKWYNGSTTVRSDTLRYSYDRFNLRPDTRQADIEVNFEYNTNNHPDLVPLSGLTLRDTTASFGFLLIDKEKHRSNYAESDKIRIKKP